MLSFQARVLVPGTCSRSRHVFSFQARVLVPGTCSRSRHVFSFQARVLVPGTCSHSRHLFSFLCWPLINPSESSLSELVLEVTGGWDKEYYEYYDCTDRIEVFACEFLPTLPAGSRHLWLPEPPPPIPSP